MAKKAQLKAQVKKLRRRVKRMRAVVKIGIKTLRERENKIAQLVSVLDQQQKPHLETVTRQRM